MAKYTTEEKIKLLQQKIKSLQSTEKAAKRKERARQLIQIGAIVSSHHPEPEKLLERLKSGKTRINLEESLLIKLYYSRPDTPTQIKTQYLPFALNLSKASILESLQTKSREQKIHIHRIEKVDVWADDTKQ